MEFAPSNELEHFEHVYVRYRAFVYAIALRALRAPAEAEDVVQSIFLQLWQNPSAYPGGNLKGWLTRVTKNRCIDAIRGRARFTTTAKPEELLRFISESVEDEVFRTLEAEWVATALSELPDVQRSVVIDAFWCGQSHQGIASSTNLPLGTVKTRMRSALERLRRKALQCRRLIDAKSESTIGLRTSARRTLNNDARIRREAYATSLSFLC